MYYFCCASICLLPLRPSSVRKLIYVPHQVICNNFADCLFFLKSGTIIRAEFQFLQYFSYEPEVMTHIMAAERIMNVI